MATQFAIVGHACRFPGGADSPEQFWQLLSQGLEVSSEIPRRCFDIEQVYEAPERSSRGGGRYRRMGVRRASLLDDGECFDATFFGISRREAKVMDPQQRQLLQVAHEAIEASGYCPSSPTPSTRAEEFGVYVAAATDDYVANLSTQEVDVFYSPATLRAFLSGRISHHFGWEGPSLVIDTACSSSLVTLHTACRAIAAGDCRSVLVAGVNMITSPAMFLGLYRGHFLSQDGRCKTFDETADGYGRAEGVAAFVVKTLDDALADGDHIEAVIRATALNQSGLAKSITHPDQATQVKLFNRVNDMAGIDASAVSVVEMHGTGTQAGDRSEVTSLSTVYGKQATTALHLSSVKANVGHSEAAAGFAGLTKLLAMLRHHEIPPQISLKTLNPQLAPLIANTRIEVHTTPQHWPAAGEAPRIALLNSIGAAGSNATALIQEWVPAREESKDRKLESDSLFCLSAKSAKAFDRLLTAFIDYIGTHRDSVSLGQLCYATMTRRIHYTSFRRALPVSAHDDLASLEAKLVEWRNGTAPKKLVSKATPVFYLLCAQHPSVERLRYHVDAEPAFRRAFEQVINAIDGSQEISTLLSSSDSEADARKTDLLAFAFEIAVVHRWQAWGLRNVTLVCQSKWAQTVARILAGDVGLEEGWQTYQTETEEPQEQQLVTLDGTPYTTTVPAGAIALGKGTMRLVTEAGVDVAQLLSDAPPEPSTASQLAKLFEHGVSLNFSKVLEGQERWPAPVELPLHPFEKDAVWVDYQHQPRVLEDAAPARTATAKKEVQRGYVISKSDAHAKGSDVRVAAVMDVSQVRDEIMGHLVAGKGMCPASVYHELAFTTLHEDVQSGRKDVVVLESARYHAPLIYNDDAPGQLVCQLLAAKQAGAFQARVGWQRSPGDRLTPHFTGTISVKKASSAALNATTIASDQLGAAIDTRQLYATFAERVVEYAPLYQTIESLSRSSDGYGGFATLKRGAFAPRGGFRDVVSPILQDTMLHTAGYLANTGPKSSPDVSFIAVSLGSFVGLLDYDDEAVQVRASTVWDERTACLKCSASAHTKTGDVLASLSDLVFKRVDAKQFSAVLTGGSSKAATTNTPKTRPAKAPDSTTTTTTTTTTPSKVNLGEKIRKIICEGTGVPASEISGDTALEELGVDSLLFIEIIEQLSTFLPGAEGLQDRASAQQTVDDFVALCTSMAPSVESSGDASEEAGSGESQEQGNSSNTPSSVRETTVRVLAHILAIDDTASLLESDASMNELGLDSLGSIELAEGLSRDLGVTTCSDTLVACQSVAELCDIVDAEVAKVQPAPSQATQSPSPAQAYSPAQVHNPSPVEKSTLLPSPSFYKTVTPSDVSFLRKALRLAENPRLIRRGASSSAAPLFLCADGSGIPASYLTLPAEQVRDIWILHHERLFDAPSHGWGVVEHAAALVAAVTDVYPTGPLFVGGWSFGGVLAWEMTHQLQAMGRVVMGTLAVDTPCPLGHAPLDGSILDALVPEDGDNTRLSQARQLIRASFLKSGDCIRRYAELPASAPTALNAARQANKPVKMALLRCSQDFKARWATDAKFDWLTRRSGDEGKKHELLGWDKLAGLDIVLDIPGSHFTPFAKRNADAVSAAIENACYLLQS